MPMPEQTPTHGLRKRKGAVGLEVADAQSQKEQRESLKSLVVNIDNPFKKITKDSTQLAAAHPQS